MVDIYTVWASAGCGKTKFCTDLAASFIKSGYCSKEQILYSTFAREATNEAASRAGVTSEERRHLWFRTLHSVCFKLLRVGRGQVVSGAKLREFGGRMGVEINDELATEEDEAADIAKIILAIERVRSSSEESGTAISKLLGMYQHARLTSESLADLDRARKEPSPSALQYFGSMDWSRYADVVESYETWKGGELLDFVDMLEQVLLRSIDLPDWKVVFIDESQDMAPLQWLVVDKLSERAKVAFYAGDDWQCLPGDEEILTSEGSKPIRDIQPGEKVISGVKSARTAEFKVLRKLEKAYEGEILEIETEGGHQVRLTPEHKVFVHWEFNKHCVYLMKQGEFFRLGMSQDVQFRNGLETNTDGVMPLSVHDDEISARKAEVLMSLRSGIPTVLFPTRHVDMARLLPAAVRREIFEEMETGEKAESLLERLGKTWDPLVKKAVWRGKIKRRSINIYPLEFKQSNPMVEYQSGRNRKESNQSRVRKYFCDVVEAKKWLRAENVEGDIRERWAFLPQKLFYRIEARNLLPDVSLLPVVKNGSLVMERVKSIRRTVFSGLVYDLEVEKAHNFCAGGIIISNCIMSFQGSSANSFLSYRKRGRKIHLPTTHRFGQKIIDLGQRIVQGLPDSEPKHIVPAKNIHNTIKRIWDVEEATEAYGSKFWLHRHREGCNALSAHCIMNGIPFWAERGANPLGKGIEIAGFKAISKLVRGEVLDGGDIKSLTKVIRSSKEINGERVKFLKHGSMSKLEDMEPDQMITPLELSQHFTEFFWDALRAGDWSVTDIRFASYYQALEESGWELGGDIEPQITITTIHGSKGRDADTVFLWDEVLPRCMKDPAELRVAYVGATRSKGPLYIVSSPVTSWRMETFPYPIEDGD